MVGDEFEICCASCVAHAHGRESTRNEFEILCASCVAHAHVWESTKSGANPLARLFLEPLVMKVKNLCVLSATESPSPIRVLLLAPPTHTCGCLLLGLSTVLHLRNLCVHD